MTSHPAQFSVNARHEALQGIRVAGGPRTKELRGFGAGDVAHALS
jgi:hypothetical protein